MERTQLHRAAPGFARTRLHATRGLRVEDLKAALANTSTVLTSHIDAAQTTLDAKIDAAQNLLNARINTTQSTLDTKIDTAQSTLDAKIDTAQSTLDAKIDTAQSTLDAKIDTAQSTLDAKIDVVQKAVQPLAPQLAEVRGDLLALDINLNRFKRELPHILEAELAPALNGITALVSDTKDINVKVDTLLERVPVVGRPDFAPEQQLPLFLCMRALNRVEDLTIDREPVREQSNRTLNRIRPPRRDALVQGCLETLPEALRERVTAVHRDFTQTEKDQEAQERLERFWEIRELRRDIFEHFAAQSGPVPDNPPGGGQPS